MGEGCKASCQLSDASTPSPKCAQSNVKKQDLTFINNGYSGLGQLCCLPSNSGLPQIIPILTVYDVSCCMQVRPRPYHLSPDPSVFLKLSSLEKFPYWWSIIVLNLVPLRQTV